jgi:hypothetical protein
MRRSLLSATPGTGFILAVPASYLSPGCLAGTAEPTSMQAAAHRAPRKSPKELLPFKAGFAAIAAAAKKGLHDRLPIIPAGLRYKES